MMIVTTELRHTRSYRSTRLLNAFEKVLVAPKRYNAATLPILGQADPVKGADSEHDRSCATTGGHVMVRAFEPFQLVDVWTY